MNGEAVRGEKPRETGRVGPGPCRRVDADGSEAAGFISLNTQFAAGEAILTASGRWVVQKRTSWCTLLDLVKLKEKKPGSRGFSVICQNICEKKAENFHS